MKQERIFQEVSLFYVCVLSACMYVHCVCVRFPQRVGEGNRFLRTGMTDICEPLHGCCEPTWVPC